MWVVTSAVFVHHPESDRDRPVSGHRQDPHQLLEVGPVVLGEPVAGSRGGLAATFVAVCLLVRTRELQRRRVVVEPRQVDVEPLDRIEDPPGQQAGPIRIEQPRQHPPHPVIVQQGDVVSRQADHRRLVAPGPLRECVHGGVTHHQVADHHPERRRGRHPQPGLKIKVGDIHRRILPAEGGPGCPLRLQHIRCKRLDRTPATTDL